MARVAHDPPFLERVLNYVGINRLVNATTNAHAWVFQKMRRQVDETTTSASVQPPDDQTRIIFVNHPQPQKFISNRISTAKYSVMSFFPLFLFEQFRRYSNCFFLFIALLQQIPDVSPTGRWTTLAPLVLILMVSAIKEIVEDCKRHMADDETNKRMIEVLRLGEWVPIRWDQLQVGDICKVVDNQFFPADLVILASSEPQGISFIETSNLDGETNLKIRQARPETDHMSSAVLLDMFHATLLCQLPNRHLYEFTGSLKQPNTKTIPLNLDQMLLRGAMLRNTAWIYGIVVYSGHETKLMKNSTKAPLKRSSIDKATNTHILLLFGVLLVLSFLSATCNEIWIYTKAHTHWYIALEEARNVNFGYNLLTFLILYNNLIPISLQVTAEIVRFFQAKFIAMDSEMYHEATDTPAMARTSNLNEELGMVKYIFSDKTGTLTCNVMEFKKCSVAEILYNPPLPTQKLEDTLVYQNISNKHPTKLELHEFLIMMAVCHTVIPEKHEDTISYHAASPDERALVLGAAQFGYVFEERSLRGVTVSIPSISVADSSEELGWIDPLSPQQELARELMNDVIDSVIDHITASASTLHARSSTLTPRRSVALLTSFTKRASNSIRGFINTNKLQSIETGIMSHPIKGSVRVHYEILNVIEFTSARKRMSVIVKTPKGEIKLYCKGADSAIYPRLAGGAETARYAYTTLQHLERFATDGLRTLVFATKTIPDKTYNEWLDLVNDSTVSILDRERKMDEAAEMIENDLKLLGATAIEDKLQDGVPETIATLLAAHINVWVLTGDKQETAINIAHSARLIDPGTPIILLNEDSLDGARATISRHVMEFGDNIRKLNDVALVTDGSTLQYAMGCDLKTDFIDLCISCKVVVCCRVSPLQKAEVVEMVSIATGAVTLAIGDGANDVAMIQRASVGVGVSGVEGLQAVCASDYSIAQFRFLLRLLFVHGSWNYFRISKLILYSFYKNICLYVIELWFAIYSAWSGQIIFERWTIGFYNVIFTALPPFAIGLFDKLCSSETMLKHPLLYLPSQKGQYFNVRVFWRWTVNALLHSIIMFWLPVAISSSLIINPNGFDGGYLLLGNMIYTYVVVGVCIKAGLTTWSWTWVTHVAIWGSIVLWFVFVPAYGNLYPHVSMGAPFRGMEVMLYTSGVFWAGLILVPIGTLLVDLMITAIHNTAFKTTTEMVRESEISHSDPEILLNTHSRTSLTETARLLQNVRSVFRRRTGSRPATELELAHGFAFSQEEGANVSQSDVIRAYDS